MGDLLLMLFLLIVTHALCDFPLQGDFMSTHKSRKDDPERWLPVLTLHSFIHSGGVYLMTASITLALFELVAHFVIDFMKGEDKISFNTDQYLHIGCKVLWAVLFMFDFF